MDIVRLPDLMSLMQPTQGPCVTILLPTPLRRHFFTEAKCTPLSRLTCPVVSHLQLCFAIEPMVVHTMRGSSVHSI